MLVLAAVTTAATSFAASYAGRKVASVLDEFRNAGVEFAYSTNVVGDDLYVAFEPDPGTPFEIMQQILQPHGLTVRDESGIYVVVRDNRQPLPTAESAIEPESLQPEIETIVIAASRYEISRDISTSRFMLDDRTIQNMPDIGEDPIRITQRLPGVAASGASARSHFRGGEDDEVGIVLNGQWLFDPFHVRDYQNIFSAIDARAVEGVEIYTGGFPVRYGDRMSGIVVMDSLESEKARVQYFTTHYG